MNESQSTESAKKPLPWKLILISVVSVLLALVIASQILIYAFAGKYSWADTLAQTIPYPAIFLTLPSVITYSEIQSDLSAIEQFYENQDFSAVGMRVDFSTPEGEKRLKIREKELINKLIEDAVIRDIVQGANQSVTDEEIEANIERKLIEYGTADQVKETLEKLYGWDMEDFKNRVVKPSLYKEKALKIYADREDRTQDENALATIEAALNDLASGDEFADVAQSYSEGSTASAGGELGWVLLSQIEPAIADELSTLNPGERSDIIESGLGYHIVLLNNVRTEGGKTFYDIDQIFTRKLTFGEWLNQKIQDTHIFVLLREYSWNRESGFVEFTDNDLRAFEQETLQEAQHAPNAQ